MRKPRDRVGCHVAGTATLDDAARHSAPADITRSSQRVSGLKPGGRQLVASIEPTALCDLFGVADPNVAAPLLSQLLSVVEPDSRKPIDPASIDQILALIAGIKPSDTLEAMTATMLVGAQHAALDCLRRGFHPDQTPAGRALYQSLALKAMRTFAQLVETLHVGRGKTVVKPESRSR